VSEKPAGLLTAQQAEMVALIEQLFWQHGKLPTNDYIAEKLRLTPSTVAKYWNDDTVRASLIKRCIDLRPEQSKDLLTAPQLLLVNMLLNQHDKRSVRQKLEECGVSSQQYHAWLRQASFVGYINQRAEQLFGASDHEAYMALLDTVRGGDVQGIKLFMEMRGKYTPRAEVQMNMEMILSKVVEIIAIHVKDPNVLNAIAYDIEGLAGGQSVIPSNTGIGAPKPPALVPDNNNDDDNSPSPGGLHI